MLKVTLGTLTTIFCIVSLIIVFYWRDIGFEPTSKDLLVFFIALPVLLTMCILSPLYIMKWLEFRKAKEEKIKNAEPTNTSHEIVLEHVEPQRTKLNLYSSHSMHAFGEDVEIKRAIQKFASPELDEKLTNMYGLPTISHRIKDLELIDAGENFQSSEFSLRLLSLIKSQFDYYGLEIQAIIEHIKKSTLFYDQQLAYEYKIHPAWINSDAEYSDQDVIEETIEPVSKFSYFNLDIILNESIVHTFDEFKCKELIEEELFNLGLLKQQIRIRFHYWDQKTAYIDWLNLLKSMEDVEDEVTCCIVLDSEIDQDILDEKFYISENYIPAEFASSCLVSSIKLKIENLFPVKTIYIIENENNLTDSLNSLNLDKSLQYENEQPFVIILDSLDGANSSKKINKFLLDSPIEIQHLLLIKQSLGHTQTLSDIWGSMLGMQSFEDEFNLVYGLNYKQIQLFILPCELDDSLELSQEFNELEK